MRYICLANQKTLLKTSPDITTCIKLFATIRVARVRIGKVSAFLQMWTQKYSQSGSAALSASGGEVQSIQD